MDKILDGLITSEREAFEIQEKEFLKRRQKMEKKALKEFQELEEKRITGEIEL